MRVITKKVLNKIILRSFYIQGSWNYQRMLNLGFCYCILPVLDVLKLDKKERIAFLQRHLEFFNAHPYFASFALGATARLEEQYYREKWPSPRPIVVFKDRLCGPLGALGDRLFWGTIRPLVALLAVLISVLWGYWGPIFLFVFYNVAHFYFRYFGVMRGYEMGFDIVRELSKRRYESYVHVLGGIGAVFLGFFLGYFALSSEAAGAILFALSFGISLIFIRLRKPIYVPIFICLAGYVAYTLLTGA